MYENGPRLVERVVGVLAHEPSGLFTDIDGTISPIVERSDDARVDERARAALDGLARRLALVAVVTGRNSTDARRMVGLDGVVYVGNHGLEIEGEVVPNARAWVRTLETVMHAVEAELTLAGVRFEPKGVSASIHYREAADPEAARSAILASLVRHAHSQGFKIEEGRLVFNILPPLEVNKGTAVASLTHEHGLRGAVYIGDDITDTHAFRALKGLSGPTLSIGVVTDETSASVRDLADARLPDVNAVADLLCGVLERLRAGVR
ncbi:MAG: trehalose-phosphatase [Chloroflexi bacterium]|nr:trehalose-phosphatase [Chloroflexota bacterium]MBV9546410.1 trehalose-phosphatase [Chloroflexota bacterium]